MERTRDEVRIPSPATAELVAHTLREVIKFLLYVRQQLPCSYDDLRSGLEESMGPEALGVGEGQRRADILPGLKRKRATSGERRSLKLFKALEAMLSRITPQMLQETRATELALLLGSTPLRQGDVHLRAERRVELLRAVRARARYRKNDGQRSAAVITRVSSGRSGLSILQRHQESICAGQGANTRDRWWRSRRFSAQERVRTASQTDQDRGRFRDEGETSRG